MSGGPYMIEMPMKDILDYHQFETRSVSDAWVRVCSPEAWEELTANVGEGGEVILYASVPERTAAFVIQAVVVGFDAENLSFEIVV